MLRRASVLATTLVVLSLAGTALAQYTGSLTSDQNSYALGESGSAAASNLDASKSYTLVLSQNPTANIATATTNTAGVAAFTFTIPATGFSAGAAQLIARPTTGTGAQAQKAITLTAAQATPTPTPTPTATATATPTATPATGTLTTDQSSYQVGETGTATGTGLSPNEAYGLDFEQSPGIIVARATTNAAGTATFRFTIPSTARNGRATLAALPDDGSGRTASRAVTITGAAAGTGGVGLPKTGRDILTYVGLGLLLILVGALMISAVRRRRSARARNGLPESDPAETTKV